MQILNLQPKFSKVFLDHKNIFFSQQVKTIFETKYQMLRLFINNFIFFQTKVKLQSVRLLAEVFDCDPGMSFQKSALSQIIMNSKSKECGPLRLHDLNPAASCHLSRTKVFILSFFKLVSKSMVKSHLNIPSIL